MQSASDSSSSQSSLKLEHKSSQRHTRNLDEKQQFALEELKASLKGDELLGEARRTDAWLLRFLRARKWDVELAKEMLLKAERWRNEFGTDEVVKDFTFDEKHEVTKYYPQYYHKTDKEGRPIYIERLGNLNMSELRKITTEERMLKYYVLETERFHSVRLPACSLQSDRPVETICTILDLRGVGLRIFWDVHSMDVCDYMDCHKGVAGPRDGEEDYDCEWRRKEGVAGADSGGESAEGSRRDVSMPRGMRDE